MPLLPGIQKHKLCLALKITFKSNKKGFGEGGVGCHAQVYRHRYIPFRSFSRYLTIQDFSLQAEHKLPLSL